MLENQDKPSDEAQLRLENELKQLNLEMEYGAIFSTSPDLPPELEGQWLDYISEFESKSKNATEMTVYSFIGQPEFKRFDDLSSEVVKIELDRLIAIMQVHNVHLDFLADYPVETIYRFITNEFFTPHMNVMQMPGMMHGFIYEEFHPNDEYDLKRDVGVDKSVNLCHPRQSNLCHVRQSKLCHTTPT